MFRTHHSALAFSLLSLCGLTVGCVPVDSQESGSDKEEASEDGSGEEVGTDDQALVGGTAAVGAPGSVGDIGGCTATLVDPRFVITAAHCLSGTGPVSGNFNYAGAAASSPLQYGHALWNPYPPQSGYEHDVALVRLTQPAVAATPSVIAASLPASGTACIKYGVGCQNRTTQQGGGFLQQLSFNWPTSYANCPGDSGGPAFCGGQIAGINSGYSGGSGLDIEAQAYEGIPMLNAVRTLGSPTVYNTPLATFASWASTAGVKVVSGDFDGSGRSDIALVGGAGWTSIPVAFGSSGSPITWTVTTAGITDFGAWASQARGAVVGDFNGDHKDDIALYGGAGWTTIPIAYSTGNGSFTTTNSAQAGDLAHWWNHPQAKVAAGDIDADGDADLIISGVSGWGTLPVGRSSRDGTFVPASNPAGDFPTWATTAGAVLLAGDFNGDGATDVALTGPSGWGSIPVAYSKFDGTWTVTNPGVPYFPAWVTAPGVRFTVGDYDGDGDDDIASSGGQGWVTALFALSSRDGFEPANMPVADFPLWASVSTLVSGDFNADGRDDLAVAGGPSWSSVPLLVTAPAMPWITLGDAQWGSFAASDSQLNGKAVDDYYFTADVSTPVSVALTRGAAGPLDPVLQVIDTTTWTVVAENDDDGIMFRDSRLSFTPVSGRTYVFRASTYVAGATGDYRIMVAPGVVVKGGSYSGTLEGRDGKHPTRPGKFADDLLLVPLSSGNVTIQLNGAGFDTYMEVLDENTGISLGVNDDCYGGTLNSCLTLNATDHLPLVIRVSSYSAQVTGNYTVTVN